MRTAVLCSILVSGISPAADLCAVKPPPPRDETPAEWKPKLPTTKAEFEKLAKEGPRAPWLPYSNQSPCKVEHPDATVVDVTDEWIEVRVKGKTETVKYPAHALLVSGGVCHWEGDSCCYLLDDVRKGDEIVLGVGTADKEKGPECFYLSIRRRPDGVIPPSRKPSLSPYDKERQRQLDYEDRGGYTPEELRDYEEAKEYRTRKGLPPPPPLPERKPRAKPTDEPKKDEPKKEEPKK